MEKSLEKKLISEVSTPFYVFDINVLRDRIDYLNSMMPENVHLCYAMKANPFVVKEIDEIIEKYEICSYGEWNIAKKMGVSDSKMVISGVYKDEISMEDILNNYKNGEVFTIESLNQIELLNKLTKEKKKVINIILRLTSGNQFGMCEEEIIEILENRAKYEYLNIMGIQYFSGTQKKLSKRIIKELEYVDEFVLNLKNNLGFVIEELEFGPGFPVVYFETEQDFDEQTYLMEIADKIKNMKYQGHITMELGRSIVASCGSYYTKVVDKKTNKEGNFAVLDGGMNHLVYYGQMMAMKKPMLDILPKREDKILENWNLVGSLCTINDLIVKQLPVSNLEIGDIFVFKNTGAYSMTEGISLFLSRDLPKVVFVQGGEMKIVRENINTYKFNMPNEGGEI
ncbi:diaminopimelate decarboxylase [Firmicutes bacterium CAG:460]|nr:diaminopimelate decarboxylase [Firmicutes bacterium CAG:460]